MKNLLLFLVAFLGIQSLVTGQAAQFAVVRPNGTTFICPSLDSAYNTSLNGDFLYLPGGSYGFTDPIAKSIHIYGAGIHTDSSSSTTRTILGNISLVEGSENGSITGCYFPSGGYYGGPSITVNGNIENYGISYCYLEGGIKFNSVATGFLISNNIVKAYGQGCLYGGSWSLQLQGQNHLIANNQFTATVASTGGNLYRNNLFTYCVAYCQPFSCTDEEFENNIIGCGGGVSNSVFNNNLGWNNGLDGQNNQGYNNYPLTVPLDSLFVDYPGGWDIGNLHLVPNSPYEEAGTDGTELGIYGGILPTSEGWAPKNPHIYFKDIDQVTGPDGKLHIEVGVRTNN